MATSRFAVVVGLAIALVACEGTSGSSGPRSPVALPEPELIAIGSVFAYEVGGTPLVDFHGGTTVVYEMVVDGVLVRVPAPRSWYPSFAGAVWMQSLENEGARFVVYLAKDHEAEFRTVWRARDAQAAAVVTMSDIHAIGSDRKPLLYTYCRSDDGRCGVVYALLTDPAKPTSGIVVHGSWPAKCDFRFRPIAVASANGVRLGN